MSSSVLLPYPYSFLSSLLSFLLSSVFDRIRVLDSLPLFRSPWDAVPSIRPLQWVETHEDITAVQYCAGLVFVGTGTGRLRVVSGNGKKVCEVNCGEGVEELSVEGMETRREVGNRVVENRWFTVVVGSGRKVKVYRVSSLNWVFHWQFQYGVGEKEVFNVQIPMGLLKSGQQLANYNDEGMNGNSGSDGLLKTPFAVSKELSLGVILNPLHSALENIKLPLIISNVKVSSDHCRLAVSLIDGSVLVFEIIKILPEAVTSVGQEGNIVSTSLTTLSNPIIIEAPKPCVGDLQNYLRDLNAQTSKQDSRTPSSLASFLASIPNLSASELSAIFLQPETTFICTLEALSSTSRSRTRILPFEKKVLSSLKLQNDFWSFTSPSLLLQFFLMIPDANFVSSSNGGKEKSHSIRIRWNNKNILQSYSLPFVDSSCFDPFFDPANRKLEKKEAFEPKILSTFSFSDIITCIRANADGDLVAVGLLNGSVIVLDTIMNCHKHVLEQHSGAVSALFFYSNLFLVSASTDGCMHINYLNPNQVRIAGENEVNSQSKIGIVKRTKPFPTPISNLAGIAEFPIVLCSLHGFESIFVFDLLSGEIIGQLECSSDPIATKQHLTQMSKTRGSQSSLPYPHMIVVPRASVESSVLSESINQANDKIIIPSVQSLSRLTPLCSQFANTAFCIGWKSTNTNITKDRLNQTFNTFVIEEEEELDIASPTPAVPATDSIHIGGNRMDMFTPRALSKKDYKVGRLLMFPPLHIIHTLFPTITNASQKFDADPLVLFRSVPQSLRHLPASFDFLDHENIDANLLSLSSSALTMKKGMNLSQTSSSVALKKKTFKKNITITNHSTVKMDSHIFSKRVEDIGWNSTSTLDLQKKIDSILLQQSTHSRSRELRQQSRLVEIAAQIEANEGRIKKQ